MSRQSNDLYSNIELVPDDYSDDKQIQVIVPLI